MRLSSIETVEVNDDFIKAAADCEHLCPQFHPALQSGSDTVLQRMRRRYRVDRFLSRLEQIREMLGNDPAFSTDVIVGFPGETDKEFEETLKTCRQARFMKVHVFPYSRRDGTPAAEFSNQVPGSVIRERVTALGELERELALKFYETRVQSGAEQLVFAEGFSEHRTGWVKGSDQWYIPVEVPGDKRDLGQFVRCKAVSATREHVTSARISDAGLAKPQSIDIATHAE
jgi:threonylcarbamoyladenosine tRNA methylthiotransferase MtaB